MLGRLISQSCRRLQFLSKVNINEFGSERDTRKLDIEASEVEMQRCSHKPRLVYVSSTQGELSVWGI